jgi:hypothetical protein
MSDEVRPVHLANGNLAVPMLVFTEYQSAHEQRHQTLEATVNETRTDVKTIMSRQMPGWLITTFVGPFILLTVNYFIAGHH